jgi:hypothetical protein
MKVDFFAAISDGEFECLDFHDVNSLSDQEKGKTSEGIRKILYLLLEDLDYQHRVEPTDELLRYEIQDCSNEHLAPLFPDKEKVLHSILECSAECAEYFYPLCQHETKLIMAIITSIFVASDDNSILNPEERRSLSYFSFNHYQILPEESRWHTVLSKGLKMCAEYFGSQDPLIGSLTARSYCSFVDACAQETRLEHELPLHILDHGPSHLNSEDCSVEGFPDYFRSSSAAPLLYLVPIFKISRQKEVPAHFWTSVIPAISKFINHMNDLLSCPKEVLAGESWNYLSMKTKTKRQAGRPTIFKSKYSGLWTFRDTLYETISEMQRTTLALDKAFTQCIMTEMLGLSAHTNDASRCAKKKQSQVHEEVQLAAQLWTAYKHGYIAWHINCNRYGLERLPFEGYTYMVK